MGSTSRRSSKSTATPFNFKVLTSFRCLSIGRSHAITGNVSNALGLINHAFGICQQSTAKLPKTTESPSGTAPLNVDITPDYINYLGKLLNGELQRHRAIVHIDNLRKKEQEAISTTVQTPLVERLHEFPAGGVDLNNIVDFPPKMALIPMKPIFLDVAWNYIDYPGKMREAGPSKTAGPARGSAAEPASEPAQQPKKGWFGFGRS